MRIKVEHNREQNGIELTFPNKPAPQVISELREHGFRWHQKKHLWYAKETNQRILFVDRLTDRMLEPGEVKYRIEPHPYSTGPETSHFIEAFTKTENGEIPGRAFYVGSIEKCREYVSALQNGEMTEEEVDILGQEEGRLHLLDEEAAKAREEAEKQEKSQSQSSKSSGSSSVMKAKRSGKVKTDAKPKEGPNTFAAVYDSVGDQPIEKDSEVSLIHNRSAYYADLQLEYQRYNRVDSRIMLRELQNAGKPGKSCRQWTIRDGNDGNDAEFALQKSGIESVRDLYEALSSGRELQGVTVSVQERKGVDVFSPFAEYKPLTEIPESWTKTNFLRAVMSGQVYAAEVAYHYTDDYAMDAANNGSKGYRLDLPRFAKDAVEDWGSMTSVYNRSRDGRKAEISYSEHSNSAKNLKVDLDCNIREGKRREEEYVAGLQKFNQMMESTVRSFPKEQFERDKVYVMQELDRDTNTGKYSTKSRTSAGWVLQESADEGKVMAISCKEMQIFDDHTYSVANFHHRPRTDMLEDPRVIDCGNYQCIVTGKALKELLQEETYLPQIAEAPCEYGPTCKEALATLEAFSSGKSRFGFTNAAYAESILKLRVQESLAEPGPKSLSSLLENARERKAQSHSSAPTRIETMQATR